MTTDPSCRGLRLISYWKTLAVDFGACFHYSIKMKHPHGSNLISHLASDAVLDAAFEHVYASRKSNHHNSDIWDLSLHWRDERASIRNQLLSNRYQLSPLHVSTHPQIGTVSRWSSRDAVVLKALSMALAPLVGSQVSQHCYHLKGNGGLKGACRVVAAKIQSYRYVCKSDIASYYQRMDHHIVLSQLKCFICDKRIMNLFAQYLNRVEVYQGEHQLVTSGIPKGCPLSPLIGGLLLKSLDDVIPKDCLYARYMDDWVICVKTRRQLRRIVKKMHGVLAQLKFNLAIDKTFIGRIAKGFDFLGYRFGPQGIMGLAHKTISNFIERLIRLYESDAMESRIDQYVRHWQRWCTAGL